MPDTCIAISTCDRHDMLRQLLQTLSGQPGHASRTILIADNGASPAEGVVAEFRSRLDIVYERVAERGVSPARNCTLRMAIARGATYLALIDDDELPEPGWVSALLSVAQRTDADLVYGAVRPIYLVPPPRWVEANGFFHKGGCHHGTENLLVRLSALPADERSWFRIEFARTGGSDLDLIERLLRAGARDAVAEQAVVHELIPASRLTLRYILQRGQRDGASAAQFIRLRHTRLGCVAAAGDRAAAKLAYAVNHLFWAALGDRARFYCAAGDLSFVASHLLSFCGVRFEMYGLQSQPA